MSEATTLHQAISAPAPFEAGGVSIPLRKLRVRDWQPMQSIYALLLQTMARRKPDGYTITDEDVRLDMAAVLLDAWTAGQRGDAQLLIEALEPEQAERVRQAIQAGRDGVLQFLSYFTEGLTAEQLDALETVEDWERLWACIYEANQRPFVRQREQMALDGELDPLTLRQSGQHFFTAPDSTPEIETSPSSTPSSSPAATSAGKRSGPKRPPSSSA